MKTSCMMTGMAVALLVLCSCSVKEDRSLCPCYVDLIVDEFVRDGFSSGTVAFSSDGFDSRDDIILADYVPDGYSVAVPRREVKAACVCGLDKSHVSGNSIYIPAGEASDPIMSYRELFLPQGDEHRLYAVPHKQYCRVDFLLENPMEEYPYIFRVRGDCSGLDIFDLQPVRGSFSTLVYPNTLGEYRTLLLRQSSDSSLFLDVLLPAGDSEADWELQYTVSLSDALAAVYYDWTKEDLDDVSLRIDYARAEVTVEISEWEGSENDKNVEI